MTTIDPMLRMLIELLVVGGLLLLADQWLHRHLQGVMLLLTNDEELALWLYAILLFPGVALHELSHAVVARILGVEIGRINVLPHRVGKRIQLGFVPVRETDFVRASLIGAAPLVFGGLTVIAIGHFVFGTPDMIAALSASNWPAALRALTAALHAPDAWIWAYLIFAIGNTMLPSRSDVHAWPFLLSSLFVLAMVVAFIGGGMMLLNGFSRALTISVRWLVLLGGSTLLIDLPFFALIFLVEKLLAWLKGVQVEYR